MAQAASASIPQACSIQEAAAQIVALINSSPRSPRQEEIEAILAKVVTSGAAPATPLVAEIRDTAARLHEAFAVMGKVLPTDKQGEEAAQARIDELQDRLEELGDEIQNPPRSIADLVAWAEIAQAGADVRKDGTMAEVESGDVFLRPAARLVEAVLQFPGAASVAAMSPAHAAFHSEWRGLIETHVREFDPGRHVDGGYTDAVKADEERMAAHMEIIDALADKILAEPVPTCGDLLPYAEVAFWYQWPGVDSHGPDASGQMDAGPMNGGKAVDQAVAKVLKGIFSLAGIGRFASEVRS